MIIGINNFLFVFDNKMFVLLVCSDFIGPEQEFKNLW